MKKKPSEVFSESRLKDDPVVGELIQAQRDRDEVELADAKDELERLKGQGSEKDSTISRLTQQAKDAKTAQAAEESKTDPFLVANGVQPEDLETVNAKIGDDDGQSAEDSDAEDFLASNGLSDADLDEKPGDVFMGENGLKPEDLDGETGDPFLQENRLTDADLARA